MRAFKVDLTNCDKEPIHIPGKIQSHGFLVAVDKQTSIITYISQNITLYTEQIAASFLGKELSHLFIALETDPSSNTFRQFTNQGRLNNDLENHNPYHLEWDGKKMNVIVTASGDHLLLEFEPSEPDVFEEKSIGKSISRILMNTTVSTLLKSTAKEIKAVIDYDRVMVYKFGEDGHGQIIAEEKNEDLQPFLGFYYPASDIPKQARELYKLNLTRIIADVETSPIPILTSAINDQPLDLTHSELRAVSPIHIQYLKNMGVASSFSITLLAKGELWGLISCHSYSPKFINYKARESAKLIGQILSSALEQREGEEDAEKFNLLNEKASKLIALIDTEAHIAVAITAHQITIKDITNATGAAVISGEEISCVGDTPDQQEIADLVSWLTKNTQEMIFHSNRFPEIYQPALKYSKVASGILSCILSRELNEMIIWFKPEQLQKRSWAGDPDKPVEVDANGTMQLTPRKSFESWAEIVKNTSEEWTRAEIANIVNIREHLIYTIKRKANEIRSLNEKLVLAYEELDTFSYTISHDLRTPLSAIKSYSELLSVTNDSLDENARNILGKINKCADKMTLLIQEILNYSRLGKSELNLVPLDIGTILCEIKNEMINAFNLDPSKILIGETPPISGDPVMINQVFANLMSNAIKYSAKANPQCVKVSGKIVQNEIIYSISDNGIGIDINHYNRVFELFKRMDNVEDIEGTGVGLSIVKRIVEKHQARIWFESVLGEGTTFYLAFKNHQ